MMKRKLLIVLSLLLVFSFDGLVPAANTEGSNGSPALSPDGIAVSSPQRRRKRRRRYKTQRPATYPETEMPNAGAAPPEQPSPPPPPAPAQEEMPTTAAPAPPSADPMDAPGRGRPAKKSAPRIKPPTVSIKPPTE